MSKQVGVQTSQMQMLSSNTELQSWETYDEDISSLDDNSMITAVGLLEQINVTRDRTDYLWYMTRWDWWHQVTLGYLTPVISLLYVLTYYLYWGVTWVCVLGQRISILRWLIHVVPTCSIRFCINCLLEIFLERSKLDEHHQRALRLNL